MINDMTETEVENPTVPETAYALIFHEDQQIELVVPARDDEMMTDGHVLLLGLVSLLSEPGWAQKVIDQTATMLTEAKREAIEGSETTK